MSLEVRNFESSKLKVNDQIGNPDRDRRHRRLARGRDGRGDVPGRRLRALRARADGVGGAVLATTFPLRRARGGPALAARIGDGSVASAGEEIQERLAEGRASR